jgi:cysteinyl-tRNA synthetase
VHETGATLPIDALRDPARGLVAVGAPPAAVAAAIEAPAAPTAPATSLAAEAEAAEAAFAAALDANDAAGAARAALELEAAIRNWSADTLRSDETDRANATLRSMIVRLGDAAVRGLVDPRAVAGPYMDIILALRTVVRADKRYDLSDLIRDRLAAIGVEVRDTPTGAEWFLGD